MASYQKRKKEGIGIMSVRQAKAGVIQPVQVRLR
jgi:hypothetical protein